MRHQGRLVAVCALAWTLTTPSGGHARTSGPAETPSAAAPAPTPPASEGPADADAERPPATSTSTSTSTNARPSTSLRPTPKGAAAVAGSGTTRVGGDVFHLPPAELLDSYGPRPPKVPTLTRDQIVQYSLQNPYVKAADAEIEAMQQVLLRAKFAWVPSVSTTLAIAPGVNVECNDVPIEGTGETFQLCRPPGGEDIYTIGGYLRQLPDAGVLVRFTFDLVIPIYTFGKIKNARKMAEAGVALRTLNRERIRQETVLRVYQAHAALLLARDSIALLEEVWGMVQKARAQIEQDLDDDDDDDWGADGSSGGSRDPADLTRLELIELELEARALQAREIEAVSLQTLWTLAGKSAPRGFDIDERLLEADALEGGLKPVAYYRELAARKRPEAGLATQNVELRRAAERLSRSNFLPDIGVLIRGNFGYMSAVDPAITSELYYSPNYNYTLLYLALGLNWKLDFHNYTWNMRKARAERVAAEHTRDAANALLALEVDKAYRRLQREQRDVDLAQRAGKKARQIVVQLQVRESVGGGDFEKLGRALKDWAEWRFKFLQALYLHNVATAELARAVGTPLVKQP